MKRLTFIFVSLGILAGSVMQAQVITANQFQNKADAAFERKDNNTALAHYLSVLKDEPDRSDLYWKTAEAARITRHFAVAEKYYEALSKNTELSKNLPLLDYNLGLVKKSLGKYDEALALFQKYATTAGGNTLAATATSEIASTQWAKKTTLIKPYEVVHLDDKVNTHYVDAAPVQYGSTLYYTSAYLKTPDDAAPVTHIFSTDLKQKGMPIAINSQIQGIHTAHYAPNTDGSRLYYNLCEQGDNDGFTCQIYVREKSADGSWGKPSILDTTTVNITGFTSTQPNVGFDKSIGKEVLYFVSDRPGGKGALDIWASVIEPNGKVNTPANLSDINTPKDDITPFYVNDAQSLLFSTEGGDKSIGGFDIFKSEKSAAGFKSPENIGSPMNSSYDDMYPSFSPENAKYYFVSNRPGGMCDSPDKDCICNDIYMNEIKVSLDASTFLVDGKKDLNGCRLELIDVETGQRVKEEVNLEENSFKFPLDPNKKYRLIATKKGYSPDTTDFNTAGLYLPHTVISKELVLSPSLRLQVYVFDKTDMKALNGSTVEIRSEDGKTLYTTETLKGNLLTWDGIEFGKKYRLVAFKDSYGNDSKTRPIDPWSATITKFAYSDSLYLTPFNGLPLTLYYDNDYPDPRSHQPTTTYTYGETYNSYSSRQAEYLNEYYKDNRNVSSGAANDVSDFFENKIKFGNDKLMEFTTKLTQYLVNGHGMEIVLEGYASPLAETEYNRILTSRRVSAVINHFYKYNNGQLRPFLKNGQLRLRVEPFGEDRADKGVSDNAKDRHNSVFSLPAMKERKVEIKEINTFQYNPNDGYSINAALSPYLDVEELSRRKKAGMSNGMDLKEGKSSKAAFMGDYANNESRLATKKQNLQVVIVDSYTGKIVDNGTSVSFIDQSSDKVIGKAKHKGKSYSYNIDLNKNYLIKGTAPGYSEATISKYSTNYTEGVHETETDTLYVTPFSGLPLPLYFDNDKPVSSTTSETTSFAYDATYRQFLTRKSDFIKAYTKIAEANGGIIVPQNEMNMFFDSEVKGGYDRLAGFSNILKSYLQRGYQLKIVVEGYASPLANAEYNQKLAARRVSSLINYFSTASGNSLKKYITSGQLNIAVEPFGEVNTSVSDDIKNASSIYSLEASRERKVVIKDVIILNNVYYKN